MMLFLLATAFAQNPEDLEDYREDIGGGAVVNWTTLTLEVSKTAQGRGVGATRKVVEASARSDLGEQVQSAVGGVHVARDIDVNDLLRDPDLMEIVGSRSVRWAVGETRYYSSGRIEVVAEIELLDLLKPYSMHVQHVRPQIVRQPAITGVVIDARGSGAQPVWAPIVQSPGGRVLWDGALWSDAAAGTTPVFWLPDPAHSAIVRVGPEPMVVRATGGDRGTLVLDEMDAVRFRTALDGSDVLRAGAIAVILDP